MKIKVILLFIIFLISGIRTEAQVQLTSIKNSPSKWVIPVAKRVIPGEPGYFQTYMRLPALMDSLGIDTTGGGGGSGTVKGTGTATRVAFWAAADSIISDAALYWDNVNKRLGIGTVNPTANLHVTGNVRIEGGSGTPITLMGRSSTGLVNIVNLGSGFTITSGILNYAETSTGTVTSIATGNGITGGTITTSGTLGLTAQALALHNFTETGYMVRTGPSSFVGRTFQPGTGISITNASGTAGNTVITNTGDLSNTNEIQTLSFSSPNLSISGGNSVTLPLLPVGTSSQTLAYLSGAWAASSFLKTTAISTTTGNSKRVTINDDIGGESWPLSYNTATKLLVNGKVQMNSTSGTACNTIMGRNSDMEVGTVTIGPTLDLTSGLLTKKQIVAGLNRSSSSSTFSTTSTAAKIDFNQEYIAVNGTTSTANDNILTSVANAGAYRIECECQFNPGSTTTYFFGIYKNGSLLGTLAQQYVATSGTTFDVQLSAYTTSLATTDPVDVRVSSSISTSGNTVGKCQLVLHNL
jgi:hypothetical protein